MSEVVPVPALCILGATGSIGASTLDVAQRLGLPVYAVTAHRRVAELAACAVRAGARLAVIGDPALWPELRRALAGSGVAAAAGPQALCEAATAPEVGAVVAAIVGAAGLAPTIAAARAGKRLCIANKEPLVMAGPLVLAAARAGGAQIVPVDSEHSAIFQCLEGHRVEEVAELILTASGGPFRTVRDLSAVTVEQALVHPTWSMGPKITIDSATLMNKSLEVIEAQVLFGVPAERVRVLIHPQSIVHSMVAFRDGSVLAQLGLPDMRTPIQYALTWPRHRPGPVPAPDFARLGALTFEEPDRRRFPSLDLAYEAARRGGLAPAVLNAANEVAVAAFLAGRVRFLDIFAIVERALRELDDVAEPSLEDILAADAATRARYA
ncbi:MAG: 1-deoxy-D-xylulose-5-phosphate reductoisomerase [Planctomycetota bacterium]|nr:1-deoxy-D-xylulose-5-phosphate reductoisomerase [Planctomycetota bacterium]MCX8040353.1 1-deoxy-D-xylulose-5-phosphate reductoisomerase [Planctomycetota bacterium]MDW8373809.1 1-deoxy-D-xylulose-5-phosphate reductoisomerase [Planctomycetota bacterium]